MDPKKLKERDLKRIGKSEEQIKSELIAVSKEFTERAEKDKAEKRQKRIDQLAHRGELKVFDAEDNKWVDITPEMQNEANFVYQGIMMSSFTTAMGIKRIFDKKLFLALGCQSRDEFIETRLPFNRRQAYKYYRIADKFRPLLEVHSSALSSENNEKIKQLPINVIDNLLTELDEEELKELAKEGKVSGGGKTLSLDKLKELSQREAQKEISKFKKKYSDKVSQLDEEVRLLKAEKKVTDKENDLLKKKNDEMERELMVNGPPATFEADKRRTLELSEKMLRDFNMAVIRASITEDDNESLITKLIYIIDEVSEVRLRLLGRYDGIMGNRDSYKSDPKWLEKVKTIPIGGKKN